ncbi:MAG: PAS domain S-box protein, partial [Deltaproteobacteria bacterium]
MLWLALVVPLLLLGIFTLAASLQVSSLLDVSRWVDHTDQVIGQARLVDKLLLDMETGLRGYLLTQETGFLEPFESSSRQIGPAVQRLAALVADNPSQLRVARELASAVEAWIAREQPLAGLVRIQPGADLRRELEAQKRLTDELRLRADAFVATETGLRDRRVAKTEHQDRLLLEARLALMLAIGAFLAFAGRRQLLGLSATYERALAEADARALEVARGREELQITLQSIGDGVIATDGEARVTRMNAVAEALTGWSLAEALGRPLDEVFHIVNEETRAPVESPTRKVLRDGVVVGLANHTALLSRNGTERPIADSGAPIRDPSGTIHGVVLVFRDQTREHEAALAQRRSEAQRHELEQRAAQLALEASDQRLRLILQSVKDYGLATLDPEGRITAWGAGAERLFGFGAAERVGQPFSALYSGAELEGGRAAEALQRAALAGSFEEEGWKVRKDGSRFWANAVTSALRIGDALSGFVTVTRDFTERKRLEDASREDAAQAKATALEATTGLGRAEEALRRTEGQMRHLQKMDAIGRLAGGIAHDFNNLLSVILSYSQMLMRQLSPQDPMLTELGEIHGAGQRAATLTRQLLAFSRQQVLTPRVVDLDGVVRPMENMMRRLIGEDIELTIRSVPDRHVVKVDPGQLEQVLMNLVVNARDAMPQGGKLMIEIDEAVLDEAFASSHPGIRAGAHTLLAVTD